MASWHQDRPRRPGDTMGQGGWTHPASFHFPPPRPSLLKRAVPFLILIAVTVVLTAILIALAAHSS